jgi:hypothetical protein
VINVGRKWENSGMVVDQRHHLTPADLNAFATEIIEGVKEGRDTARSSA